MRPLIAIDFGIICPLASVLCLNAQGVCLRYLSRERGGATARVKRKLCIRTGSSTHPRLTARGTVIVSRIAVILSGKGNTNQLALAESASEKTK